MSGGRQLCPLSEMEEGSLKTRIIHRRDVLAKYLRASVIFFIARSACQIEESLLLELQVPCSFLGTL